MIPYWNWERNVRVQPVASINTLEIFGNSLEDANLGDMFLAHLLIPHAPYMLSIDCQARKIETWYNRVPLTGVNTLETRRVRYLAYIQQATCTLQKIQKIFDILKRRNLYDETIIVIHGDHGSRIGMIEPDTRSASNPKTDNDYRDAFSTLAAIKIPNTEAGYEQTPVAISQLILKFMPENLTALPIPTKGNDDEIVFMESPVTGKSIAVKRDFLGRK